MMSNDSPDAKHLKKTKSSGLDSKALSKKTANDNALSITRRKKHYPSIAAFHRHAKTKAENLSKKQERSSSLSKFFYEKLEKSEKPHYLSPLVSYKKRKNSIKKPENHLDKINELLKSHKKSEVLSLKEKLESIKTLDEKLKQTFKKKTKKKPKDLEKYLKKYKKVISSPRSEKKYSAEEKTKTKEPKKLQKKLSSPEHVLHLKKLKHKNEEKCQSKKSPGRKINEDYKKKKRLKKQQIKQEDFSKTAKVESLFKLEKSYNGLFNKQRKVDINLVSKRTEATSSAETNRKKYRDLEKKDFIQDESKLRDTKTEFNLENIQSNDTLFKESVRSYDLEDSLTIPAAQNPPSETEEKKEIFDSLKPKKVEKIPIESFALILKSKHPSISIVEPSEQFKDSLEEQDSLISQNSEGSVQLISHLDIPPEQLNIEEEQDHEKKDLESGSSSSSSYSDSNSNSGGKENTQFFLSEALLDSDSESPVPEKLEEKQLSFNDELISLLISEINIFLNEVKFTERIKEVDSSREYLEDYLRTLLKKIEIDEDEILDSLNSPFSEEPELKLERIQMSHIGSLVSPFTYEKLLPIKIEGEMQEVLKYFNCDREITYHKMLFDVVNEALNNVRPFAFEGFPDPWSTKFDMMFGEAKSSMVLEKAKKILVKWDSVRLGPVVFDDCEQVFRQREERLGVVISQVVEYEEPSWTRYDFEETQVKLELSYLAFDFLVEELSYFLYDYLIK